jgi:hypothetical protein
MDPGVERLHERSWHVAIRFCLRLIVFSVVCGFQVALGYPSFFFSLTSLAAMLCVALALHHREFPLGRSLNHWDEALCFWLISHLGQEILQWG